MTPRTAAADPRADVPPGRRHDPAAGREARGPLARELVAALVPIYFGRVGSFVIENRNVTTEEAEDRVERQARTFERTKPYLVERWTVKAAKAAEGAG